MEIGVTVFIGDLSRIIKDNNTPKSIGITADWHWPNNPKLSVRSTLFSNHRDQAQCNTDDQSRRFYMRTCRLTIETKTEKHNLHPVCTQVTYSYTA